MHTLTKVLIIVNLVLCLILSQYVWISLAGNVQWRERYEFERDARHRDKSRLERAYSELAARREINRNVRAQNDAEIHALNSTRQALEAWKLEAVAAAADAKTTADSLMEATQDFNKISNDYKGRVDGLNRTLEELSSSKSRLFGERSTQLASLAQSHALYAERHEQYRQLEFQQFLLQEELENRRETQARFRALRPDIQAEIGDSGPVVFAQVSWVQGNSIGLNKGRRDGVQLRQKFTLTRGGRTVAIVDVLEVQNETCECVIVDLVDKNNAPKAGDEAVTKMFMNRVSTALRD